MSSVAKNPAPSDETSGKAAEKQPPKRIRRTADEARRLILDAAEARLARQGPEGLRLQDIARDVGISHPAILHHFENREGLVRALIARTNTQLRDSLLGALGENDASRDAADHIGHVFEALSDRGTARLLSWLLLTGRATEQSDAHNIMGEIVDALQARRTDYAKERGKPAPDKEDTLFLAMLTANAAFGEAIVGRQLAEAAGLDQDGIRRFRAWFAKLLNDHLGDKD
ncbi:TetR/AcrR family transcriptional regulator [Parvibaculum sp.]|uniref:TetR/AcrR family transcriptional regulator n=1 Tax=Parvibaculum sp. TaxID=2024848 RepID=UPI001B2D6B0F|nr:TetR/AcrR family transcriptional regulator [Parvibaculum sp.]MBO6668760.1 TetR/AcrR family transcriptional regulator [Parvibaculum sp.]MBO6691501.1 TetR/AcrR family transcriptional regulator [Parvibaculum sp.]MBO6714437.1 TetR/AcrR family transcriptional regulator [Parvibaculum sp.]